MIVISYAQAHAHINLDLLPVRVFYGRVVALDPYVLHKLGFGMSASVLLGVSSGMSSNRSDSFCPHLLRSMNKYCLFLDAWHRLTGAENNDMIFSSRNRFSRRRNKAFEAGENNLLGSVLGGVSM